MLEDIAILTGGQVISTDLGIEFKQVTLDMLGRATQIKVDKDNTTLVGGAGNQPFNGMIAPVKCAVKIGDGGIREAIHIDVCQQIDGNTAKIVTLTKLG